MDMDLARFCTLLGEAEETEYLDASGLSPYLMENLFYPYMEGKDIFLQSLNYDAFELNDLDRLLDYVGDLDTVYGVLSDKTNQLMKSPPAARPIRAFC